MLLLVSEKTTLRLILIKISWILGLWALLSTVAFELGRSFGRLPCVEVTGIMGGCSGNRERAMRFYAPPTLFFQSR